MRGQHTPDYYHLLGLSSHATATEVKARYRALSKQFHPDAGGSQADMTRLNQAYAVLSDTFKRAIYDAERRRLGQANATPRRPAPRPTVHYTKQKHQKSWWPKIAIGFASIVILGGFLLHLPIAEALTTSTTDDQQASKPLEITYPPEIVTPTTITPASNNPASSLQSAPSVSSGEDDDMRKQKSRESCSLANNNRLYTVEQTELLCQNLRSQQ